RAVALLVAVDDPIAAEPGAVRRVERAERGAREPGFVVEPGVLARRAAEIGAVAHLVAGDDSIAAQLRLAVAGVTRPQRAGEPARAAFLDAAARRLLLRRDAPVERVIARVARRTDPAVVARDLARLDATGERTQHEQAGDRHSLSFVEIFFVSS